MISTDMVRVGKKGNNLDYHLIPKRSWHIPTEYEHWARNWGLDPQLHLSALFCSLARRWEGTVASSARVTVEKNDLTAVFGISPRRLPYFFRDRDFQLTEHGTRKRIFHYTAAYVRPSDGVAVKGYFSGVREFMWAGMKVLITVPGLHHISLDKFNIGVSDAFWHEKNEKVISEPEIGRAFAKHIHGTSLREALQSAKREVLKDVAKR
jgi:hypothetical protein